MMDHSRTTILPFTAATEKNKNDHKNNDNIKTFVIPAKNTTIFIPAHKTA